MRQGLTPALAAISVPSAGSTGISYCTWLVRIFSEFSNVRLLNAMWHWILRPKARQWKSEKKASWESWYNAHEPTLSSLVTLVTVTQGLFLTVDVLNGDNSNFLGNGKIPYLFIKTFHNTLFKIYPDKGGTLEMRKEKYGNGYVNTLKQEISFRGKKSNFYI